MPDLAALLAFIDDLLANLVARRHEITKAELVDYVKGRLAADDNEWRRAVNEPGAKTWLVKLRVP
jgi:hypothetical protein